MRTSEVLEQAWSLINEPKKWTQGQFRQTRNNRVSYCSVGAIREAAVREPRTVCRAAEVALAEALPKSAHVKDIITYNDYRTWPTIKRWWQRAIRQAKAAEAEQLPQVQEPARIEACNESLISSLT